MTPQKHQSIIHYYFSAYGGWKAIFRSKYFWFSIVFTAILYPYWHINEWWNDVLDIIPNLLGFTLGGYAMMLAFGNEKFQKILSKINDGDDYSAFTDLNVAFVHFIVLQTLSILLALMCKAYYFTIPSSSSFYSLSEYLFIVAVPWYGFCYFLFVYSIVSTFAATFAILRLMKMYQYFLNNE